MKFQCDRCKTRYSIADEKVRGKVLKIRCKNCEAVITVREGMSPGADSLEAAPVSSEVARRAPRHTIQIPRLEPPAPGAGASGQIRTIGDGALAKGLSPARPTAPVPAQPDDDEATKLTPIPVMKPAAAVPAPAAPPVLEDEWYVSVDGEQEGPFTLAQAQARVAKKQPEEEMHGWKEDFADWLPVEKIAVLSPYVPKPPPPKKPPPPPPRPKTLTQPPGPAARNETSGAHRSPVTIPPATSAAPLAAATPRGPSGLLSVEPPPSQAEPAGAREPSVPDAMIPISSVTGPIPVVGPPSTPPPDQSDGFDFAVSEPSRIINLATLAKVSSKPAANGKHSTPAPAAPPVAAAAGTGARDSLSFPAMPASGLSMSMPVVVAPRRSTGLWLALGGALAAAVVIVIVILATRGGESKPDDSSEFVATEYQGGRSIPPSGAPTPNAPVTPPVAEVKPETPVAPAGPAVTRPRVTPTQPKNGAEAKPVVDTPIPGGKEERDPGERGDGRLEPLNPDEVAAMYRANESGLKWCYERALKADPLFKTSRTDVTITIAPSGAVTKVVMPPATASTTFGTCLNQRIKAWRFRKASGEFTMQFPIVFMKSGGF